MNGEKIIEEKESAISKEELELIAIKLIAIKNKIEELKQFIILKTPETLEEIKDNYYLEIGPGIWLFKEPEDKREESEFLGKEIVSGEKIILKKIKNDSLKKQEEWRKEKGISLGREIEDEELKAQEPKIPEDLKSGLATPNDIIKAVLGLDIEKRMEKTEIKEKALKIITHNLVKNLRIVYNPPPKILKMMDQWPYH